MAGSLAQTVAGTIVSVSASLPATQDGAGFSALTFSPIGEITDVGSFGKEYTLVTHNPLGDRRTYKNKTSYNNGALDLKLAKVTSFNSGDSGQDILNYALNSDNDYSFCVTYQDLTKTYFQGKVMSFVTNISTVNNILMAECKVEITSDTVDVSPPGAPTISLVQTGSSSVTISITAGPRGSSAITGYTVTSSPAGGIDSAAGTLTSPRTITGLTNGVTYTFTAVATSSVGNGPPSAPSSPVTPTAPPSTGVDNFVNSAPINTTKVN